MSGLKDGGRGNSAGQSTLGSSLVVAQVAFALLLLVGALLFIQSFHRLSTADAGFDPTGVLTLSINLPDGRYPEVQQQQLFFEQLLERVKALPGVDKAATMLPLLGGWQNTVMAEGQDPPRPGQEISTDITRVSPDYFQTMGISLLKGRVFDERDREGALPVAIVDRTFAEFFWPGTDALGKRVRFSTDPDSDDPWLEIVGISEHVKHYGVAADSRIEIYVPMAQDPRGFVTLAVRTSSDPRSLANSIENEVLALDANQPVNRVRTLDEITAATTSPQRLAASLLGVFSALALLLAAIGIYGVMAYTVSQQRHEIGIRMALGASANTVLKMIVFRGLKLAGTGVAIGLTLSLIATPLVASQLFGIEARDPVTFASLPAVLVIVAALACAIPAIRASRTPPVVVLRYE